MGKGDQQHCQKASEHHRTDKDDTDVQSLEGKTNERTHIWRFGKERMYTRHRAKHHDKSVPNVTRSVPTIGSIRAYPSGASLPLRRHERLQSSVRHSETRIVDVGEVEALCALQTPGELSAARRKASRSLTAEWRDARK